MTKTLRVLFLRHTPEAAAGVLEHLRQSGMALTVELVQSLEQFPDALRTFAPDVVLSNHAPARTDAAAAVATLRSVRPATPLIVVGDWFDDGAVVHSLRVGAEDFVLKDRLERLRPAIEAALSVRRPLEKLSPRQLEVLQLVAEGHTTRGIATRLNLSAKTVDTHRGEVMKRLGIHDVVGLVRYAVRVGLVEPTPAKPEPIAG
jgi:DNA-binding NarL/FixJ family response regulator